MKGGLKITKTACSRTNCPFSHRACTECGVYRGRHHYLFLSGHRGYTDESEDAIAACFQALDELADPRPAVGAETSSWQEIQLKLVDAESGTARLCDLGEAKTWDWGNPEIMRLIDGRQVKSFVMLTHIARYKAEKGQREVEIVEFPRFMLLAGG